MKPTRFLLAIFPFLLFLIFILIFFGCSEESATEPEVINEDYFPVSSKVINTYTTNAFSDSADEFITFQTKIDSFTYEGRGRYLALMGRLNETEEWIPIIAIKDSGNIIYSLGDFPSGQGFPMFKHKYESDEVFNQEIVVQNKTYQAVTFSIHSDEGSLAFWFVKGIGLVREYSEQGASLFNDDYYRTSRVIKTELISTQK